MVVRSAWGVLLLLVCGCSDPAPQLFGGSIDVAAFEEEKTTLAAVQSGKDGDHVIVEGQVGKVCKAGCWFFLESADHVVYVDVVGDYKVPLEATAKRAIVKGRISGDGGSRILEATRVALFPKTDS